MKPKTANAKRKTGPRSLDRMVRARRERINGALWDLNSALYTLRDHYKHDWTDSCFKNLNYLVRLAKKAP